MPGQAESARQTFLSVGNALRNLIDICALVSNGFQVDAPGGNTITLSAAQQTAVLNRYDALKAAADAAITNAPSSGNL